MTLSRSALFQIPETREAYRQSRDVVCRGMGPVWCWGKPWRAFCEALEGVTTHRETLIEWANTMGVLVQEGDYPHACGSDAWSREVALSSEEDPADRFVPFTGDTFNKRDRAEATRQWEMREFSEAAQYARAVKMNKR